MSSVSVLFVGRTESYAKSNRTSNQGAVVFFYHDFKPKTLNNQRVIDRYEVYFVSKKNVQINSNVRIRGNE